MMEIHVLRINSSGTLARMILVNGSL